MGLGLAFRSFFAALGSGEKAKRIEAALSGKPALEPPAKTEPAPAPKAPVKPVKPVRSEALTLLATLQREARLLDLIQEPLESYQDAQIGAAARDVLRDSSKVIKRLFGVQPLVAEGEGVAIDLPEKVSPTRFRLVGSQGGTPKRGVVVHPGWVATTCQVPEWTGGTDDALVIAPAEIETGRGS